MPVNTRPNRAFEAKQYRLGEFASEQCPYVIPAYQRPYAWTGQQVTQLMEDLLDFFGTGSAGESDTYSLGTVVCDRSPDLDGTGDVYAILDGQQRLTTIDLLLAAIDTKLENISGEKEAERSRLIVAYRYLDGHQTKRATPLPACRKQRAVIDAELTRAFGATDDPGSLAALRTFRAQLLNRVTLRRVVLPMCGAIVHEAADMFDIINMRGMRLSPLDMLKARLLTLIDDRAAEDRAAFTHLWRSLEETLNDPARAKNGLPPPATRKHATCAEPLPTLLDDILAMPDEDAVNAAIPSTRPSSAVSSDTGERGNTEDGAFLPPIDPTNLFVMANELLKHAMPALGEPQALTSTGFSAKFDALVRTGDTQAAGAGSEGESGEGKRSANVWRLMGAVNLLLQTIGHWGLYRDRKTEAFERSDDPFTLLVQTFMAGNNYRWSGQYWLLLLAATVLEHVGGLPTTRAEWLAMPKPDFKALRAPAYRRLLLWAQRTTLAGHAGSTADVFETIARTPTAEATERALNDCRALMRHDGPSWHYGEERRYWRLFLLDYALWVDKSRSWTALNRAMTAWVDQEARAKTSDAAAEVASAFQAFEWRTFRQNRPDMRIVARSQVEHWLSQERSKLGRNDTQEHDERMRRHGFGNLALINASDNSSYGKEAPAGKAQLILDAQRHARNPSLKLLWLAVLSRHFETFDGRHVKPLTDFWIGYLTGFEF